MKKIGLMGGTFNPVHIGHLLLCEQAMESMELDEVWMIPTGCSYMKREPADAMISAQERYEMAELAAAGNNRIRCLDVETKRPGYTYSYETIEELRQKFPDASFFFILGADCLFSMEQWKNPQRIFSSCSVIAAVREGSPIMEMERKKNELAAKYNAKITLLPFLSLQISSTDIRERIHQGKSIRYLVPDEVISYIEEKGLYRNEGYSAKKNQEIHGTCIR